MNAKTARFVIVLMTAFMLIMTGSCQNTTSATSSFEPSTTHGNIGIAPDGAYVTAKIMSVTKQELGFPWKLELLIQSATEMAGLANAVKDDMGKVVTVYAVQNMSSFKVNSVVTGKIRTVYDPAWNKVLYFENVAQQ